MEASGQLYGDVDGEALIMECLQRKLYLTEMRF